MTKNAGTEEFLVGKHSENPANLTLQRTRWQSTFRRLGVWLSVAAVVVSASTNTVSAWSDLDRMTMATALGDMLGSEQACGFEYDQSAIEAYVDKHVPADDMNFSSMLSMMTDGAKFQIDDMTSSQKTAHCRQIGRVAKANGFID